MEIPNKYIILQAKYEENHCFCILALYDMFPYRHAGMAWKSASTADDQVG